MIPPWVRPESPETIRIIDDATAAFPSAFGRGTTQRGIWADPRWGLRRRYRGLRSDEKAALLQALNERRGQFGVIRVTPHSPLRGSMPASELLTNNTFASGTAGWTPSAATTAPVMTVSDRIARVTIADNSGGYGIYQAVSSAVANAPYVCRACFKAGSLAGLGLTFQARLDDSNGYRNTGTLVADGMSRESVVPLTSSLTMSAWLPSGTPQAPNYFEISYTSLSRCALFDGRTNLTLQSDDFSNASWVKNACTVSANALSSPEGANTADNLVEDNTTSNHSVSQTYTVSSSAAEYMVAVAVKKQGRNFCWLQIDDGTNGGNAFFNVNTGVVGSTSLGGTGFTNVRSFIVNLGNGWYYCCMVVRKGNTATSVVSRVGATSADGTLSYLGNSAAAISIWRLTSQQSSVPGQLVQSTSTAVASSSSSAAMIPTKGWPASTNGLLLSGDWMEINGELKQVTGPVNSDAAGRAFVQFRPGLAGSPADNDPIIINEPFGRFIYPAGTSELENQFGIYADCTMDLEEIYV